MPSKSKSKVLGLALYGEQAASTRVRLSQFISPLKRYNIDLELNHLLIDDYVESLYSGNSLPVFSLVLSLFRRLRILLRLKHYDLVIVYCEVFPFLPFWFEFLFLRKTKYIYDLDDAFYLKYRSGRRKFLRFFLGSKIENLMSHASVVTAGNEVLANHARSQNQFVHILPSVVDTNFYINLEKRHRKQEEPFVLGWLGSPSTSKYLNEIIPTLEKLSKSIDIKLIVVGGAAPKIDGIVVEQYGWNLNQEVAHINNFDVGVMPLTDDEWSRGKCGYKLIQYMSCGICTIASDVGINRDIVASDCGFITNSQEDWETSIIALYKNPNLRDEMGINARKKIQKEYSLEVNSKRLSKIIHNVTDLTRDS